MLEEGRQWLWCCLVRHGFEVLSFDEASILDN
jgi:hypothetical protein